MNTHDKEVIEKGIPLGIFADMTATQADLYCLSEARATGHRYSWHYVADIIHVKYLPKNTEPKFFNIKEKVPKENENVVYYFHGKLYIGQYEKSIQPEFGTHCFHGVHGFLTDDVDWWYPVVV